MDAMKRWPVYFAALLTFGAFAAQPDRDSKKALMQLEQRWLDEETNPEALQTILASDFVHVLPVGFVTKDEQVAFQRAHSRPKSGARHFDDLRVRVFGDVGIVNGSVVATDRDGKAHKTYFTDVFAYRHHRWEAVNAQETPAS
jgi:hypothetical protein